MPRVIASMVSAIGWSTEAAGFSASACSSVCSAIAAGSSDFTGSSVVTGSTLAVSWTGSSTWTGSSIWTGSSTLTGSSAWTGSSERTGVSVAFGSSVTACSVIATSTAPFSSGTPSFLVLSGCSVGISTSSEVSVCKLKIYLIKVFFFSFEGICLLNNLCVSGLFWHCRLVSRFQLWNFFWWYNCIADCLHYEFI